ncbi:alpha/beta fold hydrolase [Saccharopolyspora sp. NFXS83]|uniref:alpha/beta hydrolase n=1 Tax=Saccharopolyspora sp. NFXS83 TaxID=2993560 RepID=UPI00224B0155|nr:alpha/beta fold hydrolase [Saccharopolyspora sp. NFXS83]MCX2728734.1 alpha/beta fold hydrolase [Saccharopolyspora sp. NFXS83]
MSAKTPGETDGVTFVNGPRSHVTATFRPRPITLTAADGVRLRGLYHRCPRSSDLAFAVGHGFTNHIRKPAVRRVLRRLAEHGSVLAVDFRGHGRSAGVTSVGPTEVQDITAALTRLRELGHRRVVTLGFSLGGSVVLRHAALAAPAERPDAMISVSGPARWWVRDTPAMRRVHWLLEQPHGRWAARLLGVRLGGEWPEVPASPIELASRLAPTPTLLVHGTDDHYFPVADAQALHAAAGGELWLEPGMRHAESATGGDLVDRMAAWARTAVGPRP